MHRHAWKSSGSRQMSHVCSLAAPPRAYYSYAKGFRQQLCHVYSLPPPRTSSIFHVCLFSSNFDGCQPAAAAARRPIIQSSIIAAMSSAAATHRQ